LTVAKDKKTHDKFKFLVTGAECAAKYETTAPGLAILRKFDEPVVPIVEKAIHCISCLLRLMKENETPSVQQFT